MPDRQHALVRLVGHRQRQSPRRLRQGLEARPQGADQDRRRKKVKLLWSVYARSVPDAKNNALTVYFPGAKQVDLVGADAYNFGNAQGLTWTAPADLFAAGLRHHPEARQEAVLDLRDRLDRPRR